MPNTYSNSGASRWTEPRRSTGPIEDDLAGVELERVATVGCGILASVPLLAAAVAWIVDALAAHL